VRGKEGDNTIMGCEDYVEQCTGVRFWDGTGSWEDWALQLIISEGEPRISPSLGTYAKQGNWLVQRDECTTNEHTRINFMPPSVPSFSEHGFLALETPPEIQDWLTSFYHSNKESGKVKIEPWDTTLTQNSFHETKMYQVDLDLEMQKKTEIGDRFLKPLIEKWSGVEDLQVTSIYGVREYYAGHWLSHHVDRETTHVLSATFSIEKMPHENMTQDDVSETGWPLEFVDWKGRTVRYEHPPGTVILYESVKGSHGRPYRNPHSSGIHLGAFFHYRPPTSWGDWPKIAHAATAAKAKRIEVVRRMSKASVEPLNPVYTDKNYGEDAIDRSIPTDDQEVEFINAGEIPLTLFWEGAKQAVAQCATVRPGESCSFGSYKGHTFFWTEAIPDIVGFSTSYGEDEIPTGLPGSRTTVRRGQVKYPFSNAYEEL